jgi:hypothetical protein
MRTPHFTHWHVTVAWWDPTHGGNLAETGAHIQFEHAGTAEEAIAVCRDWRHVPPDALITGIAVERVSTWDQRDASENT